MGASPAHPGVPVSLHDLGRHGDQLQRDLLAAHQVLGVGCLQDQRGAVAGDDGVGRGRRHGRNALLVLVSLYVFGQVVAPHEALGALVAHELLLACGRRGATHSGLAVTLGYFTFRHDTDISANTYFIQIRHQQVATTSYFQY